MMFFFSFLPFLTLIVSGAVLPPCGPGGVHEHVWGRVPTPLRSGPCCGDPGGWQGWSGGQSGHRVHHEHRGQYLYVALHQSRYAVVTADGSWGNDHFYA